jgi:rubredoxin
MGKIIFRKISLLILIGFFLISFLFITGFTQEERVDFQDESEEIELTKWVCDDCGYIYDPEEGDTENGIKPGTLFSELPEGWVCPECSAEIESFTEIEMLSWACPYCGFIYDESIEELMFSELPEGWVCPVCQSAKDDFIDGEDYDEYVATDPDIMHLHHVLAMKSKHMLVLQNVINKHLEKDSDHGSINGLMNALSSSFKTVLKTREKISEYISQLMKTEDDMVIEGENTGVDEPEEQIISSDNGDSNNDHPNNGKSNNKDKNSQKTEKEHKNNGKAKGKNK